MTPASLRQLVTSIVLLAATASWADLVVFAPDEPTDFQANGLIVGRDGGGIASSTIGQTSPGYLTVTNVITAPGQVWYTHDVLGATITPSLHGAIEHLTFSMDLRDPGTAPSDTRINLGVRQDDAFYVLPIPFRNPDSSAFAEFNTGIVGAGDFARFVSVGTSETGSLLDDSTNPDFSPSGSSIQFLIVTASGSSGAPSIRTTDFRNSLIEVSVAAIPCKQTIGAVADEMTASFSQRYFEATI